MKFEKFWILPVVCSIIAMVFVSPGLAQVDYDKAYELYKAKKYSEAIPMLEEWCNKYPKDPRGGYTLAQSYVKTKQQKKAMERLNIVLGHHPDHAPSQFLAGVLKLKSSPAKAMPHFEAAVAAKPDNGNYQYYYGSALMASKRYNEAEAALKKAVKANPKNGKAQLDLGRVLMLNKKPADAIAPLKVAAKGKRGKDLALYYLGLAQYQTSDFAGAVKSLDQASKLKGADAKIFYNLGMAHEGALGKAPGTIEACQPMIDAYSKAVEMEPDKADYNFRLGNSYEAAARAIYAKTAGNDAMSKKALGLLGKAQNSYNAAVAADASNPAKDRLAGVAEMVENIKNPKVIEEEVTE